VQRLWELSGRDIIAIALQLSLYIARNN
jgi:hypothetical protein